MFYEFGKTKPVIILQFVCILRVKYDPWLCLCEESKSITVLYNHFQYIVTLATRLFPPLLQEILIDAQTFVNPYWIKPFAFPWHRFLAWVHVNSNGLLPFINGNLENFRYCITDFTLSHAIRPMRDSSVKNTPLSCRSLSAKLTSFLKIQDICI